MVIMTAEELLQKVCCGEIGLAEISMPAGRLSREELAKFMDLLLRWMNDRKAPREAGEIERIQERSPFGEPPA